jgi:hypothetical protein
VILIQAVGSVRHSIKVLLKGKAWAVMLLASTSFFGVVFVPDVL